MKQAYMPYIQAVARLGQDSTTKSRIVAAAVAIATAQVLAVPSAPVESAEAHYASTGAMLARGEVGEYNEEAVLDCGLALDLIRKFYLVRYNSVHQTALTPATKGAFFLGFSGASRFFSAEDISFLNEYADEIFVVQMAIAEVKKTKGLTNVVA